MIGTFPITALHGRDEPWNIFVAGEVSNNKSLIEGEKHPGTYKYGFSTWAVTHLNCSNKQAIPSDSRLKGAIIQNLWSLCSHRDLPMELDMEMWEESMTAEAPAASPNSLTPSVNYSDDPGRINFFKGEYHPGFCITMMHTTFY
jgi:hypothetical protein